MKISYATILILFLYSTTAFGADFCDQKTTEAYHSPKCGLWVEKDPHRIDNVKIPFNPPYHTYSKWMLDDQAFFLAYRDVDYDPSNLIVDFYSNTDGKYVKRGSVDIDGTVVDVLMAKLTGSKYHELVFRHDDGLLQYVTVLMIHGSKFQKIFYYGATEIELVKEPQARILAKAKSSNMIEEYVWDSASTKFVKKTDYPWHKK